MIPQGVGVAETRNYGATANDKASKLIQKLLFATASVVALVFLALGRREAAIVGAAVILTLTVTLFASWAWGFTLNRVSLFALIFSIGILVDDAIVVVENIHRHQALHPDKRLVELIPGAVDEVGGPTILATLTVIAALLPMAFVSGLMGPYMSPIPINASMGMLLSLAIAFIVTPWLARLWIKHAPGTPHGTGPKGLAAKFGPLFERLFRPLLDERRGARNRALLGAGVAALIAVSLALPALGLVVLKMLPFDNKSEFQVIVDMPAGTPAERTAAVLHELGAHLATLPEVTDYQAYAGTAAPINFNGWCASITCAAAAKWATSRSIWWTSTTAASRATREKETPLDDAPGLCVVLHKPDLDVSTAHAYKALDAVPNRLSARATRDIEQVLESRDSERILARMTNDFEQAMFANHLPLALLHDEFMMARSMNSRLCGSGSAVFGVGLSRESAESTARMMRLKYENVMVCRSVTRAESVAFGEPVS